MGYASRAGRAKTNSANPQAHAICDRCGFRYNWVDLSWQFDWRGAQLANIRILVCRPCRDTPQQQLRSIVVPADPVPIINARTQDFVAASINYSSVSGGGTVDPVTGIPIPPSVNLLTQAGENSTTQPYGPPVGLTQAAQMPLKGTQAYAVLLPVISVTSNGSDQITVNCSAAHNLTTNDQVSVQGLSNNKLTGFYSVTVTTGTQFTFQSNTATPVGSLYLPTSRIVTAQVGLPYGYTKIPQTGI
jgi:hypothetical protein